MVHRHVLTEQVEDPTEEANHQVAALQKVVVQKALQKEVHLKVEANHQVVAGEVRQKVALQKEEALQKEVVLKVLQKEAHPKVVLPKVEVNHQVEEAALQKEVVQKADLRVHQKEDHPVAEANQVEVKEERKVVPAVEGEDNRNNFEQRSVLFQSGFFL